MRARLLLPRVGIIVGLIVLVGSLLSLASISALAAETRTIAAPKVLLPGTPTPTRNINIMLEGVWTSYHDPLFPLHFDYPLNWQVFSLESSAADAARMFRSPDGGSLYVYVYRNYHVRQLNATDVVSTVLVSDRIEVRRVSLLGGQNPPQEIAMFFHDGVWYEIQYVPYSSDLQLFDRLLDTIDFATIDILPAALPLYTLTSFDPCSQAGGGASWSYCPPVGSGWCSQLSAIDGIGVYSNGGSVSNGCKDT